jgi:hypothetical protein
VAVLVVGLWVAAHPVPAASVVDQAVEVVVAPVGGERPCLAGVGEAGAREVRVVGGDARVDHRDRHLGAAAGHVEGLGAVDVGVDRPGARGQPLPEVHERPQRRQQRVGRDRGQPPLRVRLGIGDAVLALERGDRAAHGGARGERQELRPGHRQTAVETGARRRPGGRALRRGGAVGEADDDLAGDHVGGGRGRARSGGERGRGESGGATGDGSEGARRQAADATAG